MTPETGPKNGSEPITARTVYLTFDDGPDPDWTPRVLELLATAGVTATFFVVGRRVQACPGLVRRIEDEGHAIGNHTLSHRHPWTMSDAAARREVRDGAAAIADATGSRPCVYRPPHGRLRACMVDEARRQGEETVLWHRSAIDWGPFGNAARIATRLAGTVAGDIVLMHDGRGRHNRPEELVQVLPVFLASLRALDLRSAPLTT